MRVDIRIWRTCVCVWVYKLARIFLVPLVWSHEPNETKYNVVAGIGGAGVVSCRLLASLVVVVVVVVVHMLTMPLV